MNLSSKPRGQGFHVWINNVLPRSRFSKEGGRPGVRSALDKEGKFGKITLLFHLELRMMGLRRTLGLVFSLQDLLKEVY